VIDSLAAAVHAACAADVEALKPGNVGVHAPGHGMRAEDFRSSARAIAPILADPALTVGTRIERSVEATVAAVGCNTNLGIVLLAAPLAQAVIAGTGADLRARVQRVLADLTVADAMSAYAGIRAARAGHLGTVGAHDVGARPQVTLLVAMRTAADRDRIARQYATGYADIFEHTLGWLAACRERWGEGYPGVTGLYLKIAAAWPDTLVARKHGETAAEAVRVRMAEVEKAFEACKNTASAESLLLEFDTDLKRRGINPGTSADLTVTTLLAQRLRLLLQG
jgi:triphosphoribosyl-dephospho-CoA synthase